MNAHRTVILAAALTVAVAAALATALAAFSGQALPRAVRHDLGRATGTAMVITGSVDASQAARYTSILPVRISAAIDGTPFAFYQATWSDPFGFVAGSLPAAPTAPAAPAGPGNIQIVEAAELGGITAHAVLLAGHWPGGHPDGAIPAALPATAAALLHVTVGDVLQLRDRVSGHLVRFAVTGLYRPRQVSSPYWSLNEVAPSGSTTVGGFTTYGPLTVPASAFAGPLAVDGGSWLALPEAAKVPPGALRNVAGNVAGLRNAVADIEPLPDLTLSTGLPAVLDRTASNLDLARSLLAICAVLLFLLAAAALLAVARLLAGQREGEAAMLAARGATRRQLVAMTMAEAVPLCLLAAAAGAVAGVLIAGMLAGTGPAPVSGVWPTAAAVGAGALVIMVVPALGPATPGTVRARRGRQAAVSRVTRAGADLALILLAVLAGWQLRHYTAVSPHNAGPNGDVGVDPVFVIAPALALAGGTVLALRLLPAGGKAGDRLAARGRRLTAALASWQISRQPIRQGGAALLIVLAVATATLALSQRQSWTRSGQDQAAFAAGADVHVQVGQALSAAQAGALVRTPGVRHAMPVATFPQPATNGETLALDASQAADVTRLRADQSPLPAATLFGQLVPAGPGPARPGPVIPGLATRSFLAATNASVGSVVQTDVNGSTVGVKIVAAVATFPTVSVSGGALVVDLGTLQRIATARSLAPVQATQWWLATSGSPPGVPPGLAASLPPGSAVMSASGTAAALLDDPLSTVPQQAMLAVAIAAAVLAVTGFCVSIAADVRQRRAETALLAALGVPPRAAAGQLCLEKLMLSVPSALAGLVLGVVLAELLVPAITLSATATTPVPPVLIELGWSQTLPLALAVAVLPVLAAALAIARRPDPAAVLRAAEAG